MLRATASHKGSKHILKFIADEWFLGIGIVSSLIFVLRTNTPTDSLSASFGPVPSFIWLFAAAFGCCLSVIRHADHLAFRLGEPYGTLILTLAVTTIEVVSISALVAHGSDNPTLVRDTIFAVIMIVLGGMVGLSLLLGGWRHLEQQFNLLGANAYLGVIIPLTVLSLILPNYTMVTAGPTLSDTQEGFVAFASLGLYAVFLAVQTARHRAYFRPDEEDEGLGHEVPNGSSHRLFVHAALMVCYMVPLVIMAEQLAAPVDAILENLHLPLSLGGAVVALLVATPEALSAIRAARANHLQRSMNILLGSVLSTIGLTIPVMICVSHYQGLKLILGLQPDRIVLLAITLAVSMVTFSSGRTNIMQGAVHLVLFGTFITLLCER